MPTRELAIQVASDLEIAASNRPTEVVAIYGGKAYEGQVAALKRGAQVVVGTPGRLIDLSKQKLLDLSKIKFMVLDEADEMLDLGFLPDVEKLFAYTPAERQTMLFSATMPAAILNLARRYQNKPLHIRIQDFYSHLPGIIHKLYNLSCIICNTHHKCCHILSVIICFEIRS